MDNSHMFLPFHSSGQSTFDPISSSMKNPNPVNGLQAHHHHEGSNGFLGLSTENRLLGTPSSELAEINGGDSGTNNCASGSESEGKRGKKKVRRPRYAFQTRSRVDILDDGYRWRKYGQKAVKANKFPRSYYRCTNQGCNVKKQVQRLTKDEGVVVTTYEGIHSHPIQKPTDNFEHILTQMHIFTTNSL